MPEAKCKCGETNPKKLNFVPSAGALISGPFPGSHYFGTAPHYPMAYRCNKCESKLARSLTMRKPAIKVKTGLMMTLDIFPVGSRRKTAKWKVQLLVPSKPMPNPDSTLERVVSKIINQPVGSFTIVGRRSFSPTIHTATVYFPHLTRVRHLHPVR